MVFLFYSVTTPTKATQQKVPQIYQIKIAEVNNSFPANKLCNQAVHLKGNRFVVILDNLLENYCKPPRFSFIKFVENFVGWPWLE